MEVSFLRLWEAINENESDEDALDDSGLETSAMRVVRHGNNLRSKADGDFWDNLLRICQDTQGLADLLGIQYQHIARWPSRIKENVEKVRRADSKEKNVMMPTENEPKAQANPGDPVRDKNPGDEPRGQGTGGGVPAQF